MSTSTTRRFGAGADKEDDELFVFGYACKLFRDDGTATEVEQMLMPWNGHSDILIDRFDGRGHLLDLQAFDANAVDKDASQPDDELELQAQLDYERYCDLFNNPEIDSEALQEEEVKRFTEEINRSDRGRGGGNYNAVAFSYDDSDKAGSNKGEDSSGSYDSTQLTEDAEPLGPRPPPDVEQALLEPFSPSPQLTELMAPATVMPTLKRQQQIIERTAAFVALNGEQMEIKMKMDKRKDPQFSFLTYGNELNPYYKQLVRLIKAGKHKPVIVEMPQRPIVPQKTDDGDSDDSGSDDGGYLHPSLLAASRLGKRSDQSAFSHPQPQVNVYETSYGKLLERLKPIVTPKNEEKKLQKKGEASTPSGALQTDVRLVSTGRVVPPPPDVKVYVDKLADYVARNGPAFEEKVRLREDTRFDFVKPDNMYYAYYRQRVAVSQKAWVERMQQKIRFDLPKASSSQTGSNNMVYSVNIDFDSSFEDQLEDGDSNASKGEAQGIASVEDASKPTSQPALSTADQLAEQRRKEEEQQRLNRLLSVARERYAKIQSERNLSITSPSSDDQKNGDDKTAFGPSLPPPDSSTSNSKQVPGDVNGSGIESRTCAEPGNAKRSRRSRSRSSSSSASSYRRRRSHRKSRWDDKNPRKSQHRHDHERRREDSSDEGRKRPRRSRHSRSRSKSRSRSRSRERHQRKNRSGRNRAETNEEAADKVRVDKPMMQEEEGKPGEKEVGIVCNQPMSIGPQLPDLPKSLETRAGIGSSLEESKGNNNSALSEEEVWRQLEMFPTESTGANTRGSSPSRETAVDKDEIVLVLGGKKPKMPPATLTNPSRSAAVVAEPVKIGEEMKAINVLQRLKALRRQEIVDSTQSSSSTRDGASGSNVPRIPYVRSRGDSPLSSKATPTQLKAQEDIKNSILNKLKQSFLS